MKNLLNALTSLTQLSLFCLSLVFLMFSSPSVCAAPPELHVVANHLENKSTGAVVRLTGVNLPSLDWGPGENLTGSATQILSVWKCNVIRLPISQSKWIAGGSYLTTVDDMVAQVSAANAYVIIDLHTGSSIAMPDDTTNDTFWPSVANRYKNNPAVIFGLYNEPSATTSWDIWRNGGTIGTTHTPGIQALLTTIRGLGANNVVVADGIKYSSDLTGITSGYALTDAGAGDGVVYDAHIYPWHGFSGWCRFAAAGTYPLLLGECGHDGSDSGGDGASFGGNSPLLYWTILSDADALGVNFTAWSFHPRGGPSLIDDTTAYSPASFSGQFVLNHILSLRDATHASTVANPSFESPVTSTFTYRPSGGSWTFAGNAGIQKTWGTAIAPGSQSAFLQTAGGADAGANGIDGSMSQTVNFVSPGTYSMSFLIAQRGTKGVLPVSVSVDGVLISSVAHTPSNVLGANFFSAVTTAPFTINATGNHTIKLTATASAGNDLEALIDNVTITATGPAWLQDQGFRLPNKSNATFGYRPTGTPWTWVGNAGVERNALGAPAGPDGAGISSSGGAQAAFLQTAAATDTGHGTTDGAISQNVEFAAPGAYAITFQAAQRSGKGALPIQVLVDGNLVGTITPSTTAFAVYTTPAFTLKEPGYHSVQLAATPNATVDNEAFIDGVGVTVPVATVTRLVPIPIACAGFETPSPAFGHGIQPTGTPWTYTGSVVVEFDHAAAIQSDGSSMSNYDGHHASEGWQTAFFTSDGTSAGTISQSINFPSAGTYVINLEIQRGRTGSEPVTLSVGGAVVGAITPVHSAFYPYTTAPFVITSPGNYTLLFTGGAVTGFTLIDSVNIWRTGTAPNTWYLHAHQPGTDNWNTLVDWFSAASGGTNPSAINSADYFDTNGFQLRTPTGSTSFSFGATVLSMNGGAIYLKYTNPGVATIPELHSSGGTVLNGNTGTLGLNVTNFVNTGTTSFDVGSNSHGLKLAFGTLSGTGGISFSGHTGGPILLGITDASAYTGTLTFSGTSPSVITFQNAINSSGGLVINTGNSVTLNYALTFDALTVNGTVYTSGTYSAATLGFTGTGSITVP